MAYHAAGQAGASDAALAELIDKHGSDAPTNVAFVTAYRGEGDRAFEWLFKAAEAGDSGLAEVLLISEFAPLYDDPRWSSLLRTVGMAPEQLAAIRFEATLPIR